MMWDEVKSRLVSGAVGVGFTTLVWIGQTTLANKTATEVHQTQIAAQSAVLQRTTERIERLDRIAERIVVVQENTAALLEKVEQRTEAEAERHRAR